MDLNRQLTRSDLSFKQCLIYSAYAWRRRNPIVIVQDPTSTRHSQYDCSSSHRYPSLGSTTVATIPKLEGTLSWIPLDLAACRVCTILILPTPTHHQNELIYHIENPKRQKRNTIFHPVDENLNLPLVAFREWIELLRSRVSPVPEPAAEFLRHIL
ncbi:hypothetical protein DM02DRAFT_658232 [Periconia macrospinosa]|uniref:Uncharacterized protein n=1 Tax=Periconia macrospinosa TaxID=97972 RepID=A0A2V1DHQ2_9PLEO|nr:hypothetical protein DM02DRAFT_658232 [Periconia macrospinosa]